MHTSPTTELGKALIGTEYGNKRETERLTPIIGNVQRLVSNPNPVHSIRSVGSAALNMCLVAEGSLDAYYEWGLHCWDMCAGCVIVREAEGVVVDPEVGKPFDIMEQSVLAACNETLARALAAEIEAVPTGRD